MWTGHVKELQSPTAAAHACTKKRKSYLRSSGRTPPPPHHESDSLPRHDSTTPRKRQRPFSVARRGREAEIVLQQQPGERDFQERGSVEPARTRPLAQAPERKLPVHVGELAAPLLPTPASGVVLRFGSHPACRRRRLAGAHEPKPVECLGVLVVRGVEH